MTVVPIKTRFAPSPTGELHVGNLRTALFSALLAKRQDGVFLLRLEDTDQERSREEFSRRLMDDLRWLGLVWNEGPEQGGSLGPYRQSERSGIYEQHYEQLRRQGSVYPCFCSPQELQLAREAQRAAGQPPRYPGTCARLSEKQVQERLQSGIRPTLRFRVPAGREVAFEDLVRGDQVFQTDAIGDFIVRRANGSPAFFFCNAIDDATMEVTHVLRGEDHLTNTPRQLLLLESLGLTAPRYGHISLIVGSDGAPLSKRQGSRSARELHDLGLYPGALTNYLARLGHTYDDNNYLELQELAEQFELGRLGRAPARFDEIQMQHWQREALAKESPGGLWQWMSEEAGELVPVEDRDAFVRLIRNNILNPGDARFWAEVMYGDQIVMDAAARDVVARTGEDFFRSALAGWDQGNHKYRLLVEYLKVNAGCKGKALFQPLRAALTGTPHGPELEQILNKLPPDRVRTRLMKCIDLAKSVAG